MGETERGYPWLADKIRDLYAGLKPDSKEGRYVAQMRDSIEQIQQLFTEGLQEASANYQAANGQKSNSDNADSKASRRDYWRPKLNQQEWNLLNREMDRQIESSKNILDPATKWLYASEKGVEVFAFYGIGDGTVPTPLYASGKKTAQSDYDKLQRFIKGDNNDAIRNRATLDRLLKTIQNKQSKSTDSVSDTQKRGTNAKNGTVSQQQRESGRKRNTNPSSDDSSSGIKRSIRDYSDSEKSEHANAALEHFGRTFSWKETGYLTQDGKKIDFSGKHEGGPGGYRTVDHRDIRDAIGEDYGGEDYSGAMVQFMSEGNIRISPESNGINLSVEPTKAQINALDDYISKVRGEVILDIDDLNGNTVSSTEYPRGTRASKVLADIRNYFDNGMLPYISEVSQFRYSTRDPELQKANQLLEKENTKLREDVQELKELLKLQRTVTGGTKFAKTSLEAAARYLKSTVNAKGDTKEFATILQDFYEYIATDGEITWESVSDMAQPAIQWLQEHTKQSRNDYAQDVLKHLRGSRISLDELKKQETAGQTK